MFKFLAVSLLIAALSGVSARPQDPQAQQGKKPIGITNQSQSIDGSGKFNFAFESEDGVKEEGSGQLKTITTGEQQGSGITQQGKYSYTSPEGTFIEVTYIADENVSWSEIRVGDGQLELLKL